MPVDTNKSEHLARKVFEREWIANRNEYTKYHWECPKGRNVYWFEVNVVDGSPLIPQCIPDDEYWSQPSSDERGVMTPIVTSREVSAKFRDASGAQGNQ